MREVKDTARALVRIGYDGRVHKIFRGPKAEERFANEVRVLRYLESRGCGFVPRLLAVEPDALKLITTNCGSRVEHLSEESRRQLFAELESFGVRHDDPDIRNVTYRNSDGRFCVIDFEFAAVAGDPPAPPVDTR
ncbi:MAG TPA: serine/threonine protein phosphatase [Opitutaceae bacterium]|jgi:tRNA A-37 threonylcarbamoyl transferase component Bud32|nr:serine/threonine protein phosphatase [Opitutaceae bacterium]